MERAELGTARDNEGRGREGGGSVVVEEPHTEILLAIIKSHCPHLKLVSSNW